jgi:hypothetical protein
LPHQQLHQCTEHAVRVTAAWAQYAREKILSKNTYSGK